jgi:hypothetical protein
VSERYSFGQAGGSASPSLTSAPARCTRETEERLLAVGRAGTACHVERIVRGWRRVDALAKAHETTLRHTRRSLSVYEDEDGMVVIRGRLTPEAGAVLVQALGAAREALYQKRRGAETSRRLACDASRVVMRHDPDGEVVEVGARTRTIPPALRRALHHRDRGCRFRRPDGRPLHDVPPPPTVPDDPVWQSTSCIPGPSSPWRSASRSMETLEETAGLSHAERACRENRQEAVSSLLRRRRLGDQGARPRVSAGDQREGKQSPRAGRPLAGGRGPRHGHALGGAPGQERGARRLA